MAERCHRTPVVQVTIAVIVCVSCERAEESSHEEVHWSYEGEGAPTPWADLRPDFALCGDGTSQSPADLGDAVPGDSVSVTRDYRPATLRIAHQEYIVDVIDNGHTIQITYDAGSTLDLGEGIVYELAQYHFHSPSEHTVNGEHYPMEMHFVHQSADDRLAVVAAFIAEGAHNPAFGPIGKIYRVCSDSGTDSTKRSEMAVRNQSTFRCSHRRFNNGRIRFAYP